FREPLFQDRSDQNERDPAGQPVSAPDAARQQAVRSVHPGMPLPGEETMNKLSKEKSKQLLLVVLMIAGALAGLYFGLIRFQYQSLKALEKKKQSADLEFREVKHAIANAG